MVKLMRRNLLVRALPPLVLVAACPGLAHAHVGGSAATGIWHGFFHPVSGLDHVAAMVAVGLWAAQRGGRAVWLVPLAFVGVMGVGGAVGMTGVSLPLVEPAIVASVLLLGVLIAAAVQLPLAASALVVGLFALFHGHAHGAEMPASASAVAYAIGFIAVTAALHLAGIGIARAASRADSTRLVRYAGGLIVICGVHLLFR